METYIVQDTTLAQLSGEFEDGFMHHHSADEFDARISGDENINNDFFNS